MWCPLPPTVSRAERPHKVPLSKEHQVTYSPSATTWFSLAPEKLRRTLVSSSRLNNLESALLRHASETLCSGLQPPLTILSRKLVKRGPSFADGSASYRPDKPMFSTLRIAGKDYSLFDLLNLDLDAQLFVLSGFQQTSLAASKGDEVFGLYRTLLYAELTNDCPQPLATKRPCPGRVRGETDGKTGLRHQRADLILGDDGRTPSDTLRSSRVGTLRSRQLRAEECSIADLA